MGSPKMLGFTGHVEIARAGLFDNVLFIFVILSVIGYGTKYKSSKMINLAIVFFV